MGPLHNKARQLLDKTEKNSNKKLAYIFKNN